jgi:hypothetical protein
MRNFSKPTDFAETRKKKRRRQLKHMPKLLITKSKLTRIRKW